MAGFATTLYNTVFRRSSTFALAIIGGSFFFERFCDATADAIFDNYNKGKQWKDIEAKYSS
uniref:Complex III subunit 9 n=1 Tax=Argas monolakensis TaxID=34602 RepID=Q09JN3_ARGMO|nr:mitochondrial ubiquinol cytochrome c reductase [Argas monolakensis]